MSQLDEWIKKYEDKLEWKRIAKVVRERKLKVLPVALERINEALALSESVSRLLDKHGVLPEFRVPYLNYAREMDRVQREYPFMVDRIREHRILRSRYETIGLSKEILDDIDKLVIWNRRIK